MSKAVHDSLRIERDYDATPARVFAAWADPAARDRWFVTGEGWSGTYQHDFRVHGRESGRFRFNDGPEITNETVYHDIVPDRRIVFAYTMGRTDGGPFSFSLATVELSPAGEGRTRMVFTEQLAMLAEGDTAAGREHGWRILLDRLADELVG